MHSYPHVATDMPQRSQAELDYILYKVGFIAQPCRNPLVTGHSPDSLDYLYTTLYVLETILSLS